MIGDWFRRFAHKASIAVGSAPAFGAAVIVVLIWLVTGPVFGFSDTWQLVINTGTTVVTFLIVFLIQNTQNRESRALHLKIDELLRASRRARTSFVNLDELSDKELDGLQEDFEKMGGRIGEVRERKRREGASGSSKTSDSSKATASSKASPSTKTSASNKASRSSKAPG